MASLIRYVAEIAKHDFAEEALREAQEWKDSPQSKVQE